MHQWTLAGNPLLLLAAVTCFLILDTTMPICSREPASKCRRTFLCQPLNECPEGASR